MLSAWLNGATYEGENEEALSVAARAIELDLMHEAGAVFDYPDALDQLEWLGLKCLTEARRNRSSKEQLEAERKALRGQKKAELEALSRRGR